MTRYLDSRQIVAVLADRPKLRLFSCQWLFWQASTRLLQLLEYLVKCGSDRVVDDARSHIPNSQRYCGGPGVPMCGIAQRSSKELVELLADVDGIRQERKMAKMNRTKYVGTGNDGFSFRLRRAFRRVRK
ncbi:hypothetical protein BGW80DRAFT_893028 [Lactifluus volemus]|nr:hypothetical protein BGW80DRAFT_893028 [Lactifluus volemus]